MCLASSRMAWTTWRARGKKVLGRVRRVIEGTHQGFAKAGAVEAAGQASGGGGEKGKEGELEVGESRGTGGVMEGRVRR